MADTRRTWAALYALFADNTAGAISAQDLRDGFQSLEPHAAAGAPGVGDDETSGFDKGHAWVDSSTTPDSLYACLDASTGAAVWAQVYPAAAAAVAWGGITGTLADQSDLNSALGGKAATSHTHTLSAITDAGTAAAAATGDFATAAQGSAADAALPATDARVPPTPVGQANGRMLAVASNALVYVDAPSGGSGGGIEPSAGLVVVTHGATASTARPTAACVLWRGSADPTNKVLGDMWDGNVGHDS